ncbi:hypothetical protein ABIE59_000287 [Marinobacter sp. MBR-99]|uniref:DUF1285 domain-containing protein n=1 Tax=Marinobacter sp. MBR-99 TaxID=3156461 RepID=UPI003398A581
MTIKPDDIEQSVKQHSAPKGLPPLHLWHPELSGDMDLVITRDGQWLYQGTPIAREATVKLFSTILRREEDGHHYLITPVEKWRIRVEDTPLLAHSLERKGDGAEQVLSLTTNVGEVLEIGPEHPLEVSRYPGSEEPRPVIKVRHGIEARLVTAAFYELADLVQEQPDNGVIQYGVLSHGKFWKIGQDG